MKKTHKQLLIAAIHEEPMTVADMERMHKVELGYISGTFTTRWEWFDHKLEELSESMLEEILNSLGKQNAPRKPRKVS